MACILRVFYKLKNIFIKKFASPLYKYFLQWFCIQHTTRRCANVVIIEQIQKVVYKIPTYFYLNRARGLPKIKRYRAFIQSGLSWPVFLGLCLKIGMFFKIFCFSFIQIFFAMVLYTTYHKGVRKCRNHRTNTESIV